MDAIVAVGLMVLAFVLTVIGLICKLEESEF